MSARTRHELAAIPLERASRLTGEQAAFRLGKEAVGDSRFSRNPFTDRARREAWHRGHTYEANLRRGLLPLDTARRLP